MASSSSAETNLATAKTVLSTAASVAATVMLARSIAQEILPHEFHDYFLFGIRKFFTRFSSQITMVIDEFDGFVPNQIFQAAEVYLGGKTALSTQRFKVTKPEKENNFVVKLEGNEEIIDIFQGVKFKWVLVCNQVESRNYIGYDNGSSLRSEVRSFEVSFPKKQKQKALELYLHYILEEAKSMAQEKKTLRIFTVNFQNMYGNFADAWKPVNLDHPAKFETVALEPELKEMIMKDLERFVKRKDYYRKVGKAWKRGYLLYGPPGTGKSSLIAAMANYLKFDIYDLELTELNCNSDLRKLLISTANRSILVVEDIDCSIELQDRLAEASDAQMTSHRFPPQKQVTLSGLLNFIDGLWSSCGDERIIIFTTNHKEKLDPALLRPGRMDVHIHMSYCSPCGFKLLASNYIGIKDHSLFGEIEELLSSTSVTPAEVAEQLMRSDEIEIVLPQLIQFLKDKELTENEENTKLKEIEEDKDNKMMVRADEEKEPKNEDRDNDESHN